MFHYATVRSKSRANKINALRPLVHSPFRSNCSSWVIVAEHRQQSNISQSIRIINDIEYLSSVILSLIAFFVATW